MARGIDSALSGRDSDVGLAVADPAFDLTCDLDPARHFDSASAIKATIISALLYKVHGPGHLTSAQRGLAWRMITESSNDAATDLWNEVGITSLQRFLDAAGMRHTILDDFAWGLSQLTAHDELTLLTVLTTHGPVLSPASRGYVLWLMSKVTASQRWGVPAGAPADVTVSVKNGWLPDPFTGAWHVNSIGAFRSLGRYRSRHIGYQIAVLTDGNPSEAYGINTIQVAAEVINRDIARV
jgi:beta-lactamase class A